jgi:hypothetical protein
MITKQLELLFILLFFLCVGVYYVGKKKKIDIIESVGKRGAIVLFVFIIVDILFLRRDLF